MLLCTECVNMAPLSPFKEHMLTPEDFLEHSLTADTQKTQKYHSSSVLHLLHFSEMQLLKDCFNISALIYLHSPIPHNCLVMIHSGFPTFHHSHQLRVQLYFKQRFAQRAPNFSAPEWRMRPTRTFHPCCKVILSRGFASLTKRGKKLKIQAALGQGHLFSPLWQSLTFMWCQYKLRDIILWHTTARSKNLCPRLT